MLTDPGRYNTFLYCFHYHSLFSISITIAPFSLLLLLSFFIYIALFSLALYLLYHSLFSIAPFSLMLPFNYCSLFSIPIAIMFKKNSVTRFFPLWLAPLYHFKVFIFLSFPCLYLFFSLYLLLYLFPPPLTA